MYGWLWSKLPGPLPVRLLTVLVSLVALVLLMFIVVFPAISPYIPFNNVTVAPTATSSNGSP